MFNLPSEYTSTLPYPEIEDACPDMQAVEVIKKLYCAYKSEMTAVLQYSYDHFVTQKFSKDIAKIFSNIAIVEMHHMELLAEAMIKFGGDPVYFDEDQPWSGKWIDYTKNLYKILHVNLQDEVNAVDSYKRASNAVKNKSLQQLFLRLATDEKIHVKILQGLLDELDFWEKQPL